MNTNPDELKLALWLEDELTGEECRAVDTWAAAHQPAKLAEREQVRQWKQQLARALPASEEPPHAEFFNARIAREIRQAAAPAARASGSSWKSWLMPVAACAGMVFAFLLGSRTSQPGVPDIDVTNAPRAIPVEPLIYTPLKGTSAEWVNHGSATASSVISINGIEAIPDNVDLLESAALPVTSGPTDTASLQPAPTFFTP